MKKYFSILAMVLVAALLVVSCEGEAKVNDYVNVSVAANGLVGDKALAVTNATVDKYEYTLTYVAGQGGEAGYGAVTTAKELALDPVTHKANLGTISQGLWELEIKGYVIEGQTRTLVVYGKARANIDAVNRTFAITMSESDSTKTGYIAVDSVTVSGMKDVRLVVEVGSTTLATITGTETPDTDGNIVSVEFSEDDIEVSVGAQLVKFTLEQNQPAEATPTVENWVKIGTQYRTINVLEDQTATVTGSTDAAAFVEAELVLGRTVSGTLTTTVTAAITDGSNADLKFTPATDGADLIASVKFYVTKVDGTRIDAGTVSAKTSGAYELSFDWTKVASTVDAVPAGNYWFTAEPVVKTNEENVTVVDAGLANAIQYNYIPTSTI